MTISPPPEALGVGHTAGPWSLGAREGDFVLVDAPKHTGLASVVWQMEDDRLCGERTPSTEANARLIAAAPDLLEALQRLSALTPRAANAATAHDLHLTVKAIADTAIARAQGGGE